MIYDLADAPRNDTDDHFRQVSCIIRDLRVFHVPSTIMNEAKIPFFTSITTVGSREAAAMESPLHRLLEQKTASDSCQGGHHQDWACKRLPALASQRPSIPTKLTRKHAWENFSDKKLRNRAHDIAMSNAEFAESSKRVMTVYSRWSEAAQEDFEWFCSESLSKWTANLKLCDTTARTLRDRNLTVPARLTVARLEEQKSRAARLQASWDKLQSSKDKVVDSMSSSEPGRGHRKDRSGGAIVVDPGVVDAFSGGIDFF